MEVMTSAWPPVICREWPARARKKNWTRSCAYENKMQFFVCEVLVYPHSSSHRALMARLWRQRALMDIQARWIACVHWLLPGDCHMSSLKWGLDTRNIFFTSWTRGYISCTCMHECSYAVRDFVLLLACGDCADDGLLLSLRFEEGSLLPVLLSCSGSPPLDGIIGLKRDGLSRHTRSLHRNLCSSKLESCARDAGGQFELEIFLLARLFRTALMRTQHLSSRARAASSWTLAETQSPHLKSELIFVLKYTLRLYLCFVGQYCSVQLKIFVLQIFAPHTGGFSALGDDFFTCTPHPCHFPSSKLHGFLVARAKSRSTFFLQAALRSQICSYFISAMSLPQLDRSTLCEKLSTAVPVSWPNSPSLPPHLHP